MIPHPYPAALPKAILFDWDDTLVDTRRVSFRGLNAALRSVGLPALTWEEFTMRPSLAIRSCFKDTLSLEEAAHAEKTFYQTLTKEHLLSLTPTQGAQELLQWLGQQTMYMAIVSNKQGDVLRKEVKHLGWDTFFTHIIGSYDTPEDKPSPTPLLHALREHTSGPGHDVWFVGDSIVDMLCASEAGCVPVSVGAQADTHEHPTIKVKNCAGLHKLLTSLALPPTPTPDKHP